MDSNINVSLINEFKHRVFMSALGELFDNYMKTLH